MKRDKCDPYLASGLVETQVMSKLLLAHRTRRVNLVAKDKERNLRELLDRKESVELGLRLCEPLEVGAVDKEDNAVDLGEVVAPEPASCAPVNDVVRVPSRDAPCW